MESRDPPPSRPTADLIEWSRSSGHLAKLTYIITSNPDRPGTALEEIFRVADRHVEYWDSVASSINRTVRTAVITIPYGIVPYG
jgi:hypothetical protein